MIYIYRTLLMKTTETQLQTSLIKYCNYIGVTVLRINGASFVKDTKNSKSKNSYIRSYILHILGKSYSSGFPDLMILHKDKFLLMELKTEKGTLTKNQKDLHDKLKQKNINVEVVRNIEQGINLINNFIKK